MRRIVIAVAPFVYAIFSASCFAESTAPQFTVTKLFEGGRFPGLAVTTKGTLLAFWGDKHLSVRRSIDEGKTFGPELVIANPGINGGGAVVNQDTGVIFAFSQPKHPPSQAYVHKSSDDGLTWVTEQLSLMSNDSNDNTELHFAGSGRFLLTPKCRGRIIRPTRVYGVADGYSNAIFSNDGSSWYLSQPFPLRATGEGSILELANGDLLYSSRRHWFSNQTAATSHRLFAISEDCGNSWKEAYEVSDLPDGPKYRNLKSGKGPTHQGHFGLMGGLASIDYDGKRILLYTNVDSNWERKGLTVWASFDNGITWPIKRRIHNSYAAYSSLSVKVDDSDADNSKIYVHFEGGDKKEYEGSFLVIFNMHWLLNGQ
jgi:sialidase-1